MSFYNSPSEQVGTFTNFTCLGKSLNRLTDLFQTERDGDFQVKRALTGFEPAKTTECQFRALVVSPD